LEKRAGCAGAQEQPNQLYWMPLGQRLQVIERGEAGLSPEADRSSRVTVGHAEGMPLAFANIYKRSRRSDPRQKEGRAIETRPPISSPGRGWAALHGRRLCRGGSGKAKGKWVDARPPMFR
jgi:hypothetical protein